MELRHLRYFLALANAATFTAAAERVHVTQSTLSHQIRQLEDELGAELFRRMGKKRVVLTDAGQLFLDYAVRALSEVDNGRARIKESGLQISGELRVAAFNVFNLNFMPECIARFIEKFPAVKVLVEEVEASKIAAQLRAGDLHVGVIWHPGELGGLTFEPLRVEEMVFVVGPKHPLYKRKRIRMAELHGRPLALMGRRFVTRELLERYFQSCAAQPVVAAEINSVPTMLKVVARTALGTVISRDALEDNAEGLAVIHLDSPTPTRTPGILWRPPHDQVVQSFVSIVREVALDPRMSLRSRLNPRH